jgi:hypothetical protein
MAVFVTGFLKISVVHYNSNFHIEQRLLFEIYSLQLMCLQYNLNLHRNLH